MIRSRRFTSRWNGDKKRSRFAFALFVSALASLVLGAFPMRAVADYAHAAAWFAGLAETDQATVRVALMITGHAEPSADPEFGPGTFEAIANFQAEQAFRPTGILSLEQRQFLNEAAEEAIPSFSFGRVNDPATGMSIAFPTWLFDDLRETERGFLWQSSVYLVDLETAAVPTTEQTFEALYDRLSQGTPTRAVTHKLLATSFFILAGREGGRSFYTRFQWAPGASVGFTMTWTPELTLFRRLATLISNSFAVQAARYPTATR